MARRIFILFLLVLVPSFVLTTEEDSSEFMSKKDKYINDQINSVVSTANAYKISKTKYIQLKYEIQHNTISSEIESKLKILKSYFQSFLTSAHNFRIAINLYEIEYKMYSNSRIYPHLLNTRDLSIKYGFKDVYIDLYSFVADETDWWRLVYSNYPSLEKEEIENVGEKSRKSQKINQEEQEEEYYKEKSPKETINEYSNFRNNENKYKGTVTTWKMKVYNKVVGFRGEEDTVINCYLNGDCNKPVVLFKTPIDQYNEINNGDWLRVTGQFYLFSENSICFFSMKIINLGAQ